MAKIKSFIKSEIVLIISLILCIISCIFVKIDRQYIEYIDYRTLALLYCLMITVAGIRKAGTFSYLAHIMFLKASNTRILSVILVCLSFFSSMLITNDVALITFVPFAVAVFGLSSQSELLLKTVVLQTVAANLGSMLTPVGNPQNIYIQSYYCLSASDFISITLPIWVISLICMLIFCFIIPKKSTSIALGETPILRSRSLIFYSLIFLICILSVVRILKWQYMLIFVVVLVTLYDYKTLKDADFFLLLTFVFFFIFSGNLARIDAIKKFLSHILLGKEYLVSLFASQIISNVPAALLLSGFTENYRDLLLGVDIGGLGTPIASLASLISMKIYTHSESSDLKKYMFFFIIVNIVMLILLSLVKVII